jgi:hypothetical protein
MTTTPSSKSTPLRSGTPAFNSESEPMPRNLARVHRGRRVSHLRRTRHCTPSGVTTIFGDERIATTLTVPVIRKPVTAGDEHPGTLRCANCPVEVRRVAGGVG